MHPGGGTPWSATDLPEQGLNHPEAQPATRRSMRNSRRRRIIMRRVLVVLVLVVLALVVAVTSAAWGGTYLLR